MHAGAAREQHDRDEVGEAREQAEEGAQAVLVDGEQADGALVGVGVRVRVRVRVGVRVRDRVRVGARVTVRAGVGAGAAPSG